MSLEVILTSISIGLLSTTSPCVLPLYPGFLAYLSGGQDNARIGRGRYFLGFFVLAGVLIMMLLLGLLISILSISVGRALSIVIPFADGMIILLGVLLLLGLNPFTRIPQIRVRLFSHPFVNAFIYGLLYGPIALPCAGPFVVSIFALSVTVGDLLGKLGVFFWFGLGFGVPLLVLSLLSGATAQWITRQFARRARLVNLIGGFLLVGIGIYDLIQNWELIQAYLL